MFFPENLRRIRTDKKITQKNLATLVGVTANTISNYENNVSFPDEVVLQKIFLALDCEPNDLFLEQKNPTAAKNDDGEDIKNMLIDMTQSVDKKTAEFILDVVQKVKGLKDSE